jgi:hypothetical protein
MNLSSQARENIAIHILNWLVLLNHVPAQRPPIHPLTRLALYEIAMSLPRYEIEYISSSICRNVEEGAGEDCNFDARIPSDDLIPLRQFAHRNRAASPIPKANSIAMKAGSADHPAGPVVGRRDP